MEKKPTAGIADTGFLRQVEESSVWTGLQVKTTFYYENGDFIENKKTEDRKEWTAEQPVGKGLKKLHVNTAETSKSTIVVYFKTWVISWMVDRSSTISSTIVVYFMTWVISWRVDRLSIISSLYFWQVRSNLAPPSADHSDTWKQCKQKHARCNSSQIQFLQGNLFCLVFESLDQYSVWTRTYDSYI